MTPLDNFKLSFNNENGNVNASVFDGVNHSNFTESETFYGIGYGLDNKERINIVFQIAYSTLGLQPSCQISCRVSIPGGNSETISLNCMAKKVHNKDHNNGRIVFVSFENKEFVRMEKNFKEAVILITMKLKSIHLDLHLSSSSHGYTANGGKVWYYGCQRKISPNPPKSFGLESCDG
jgi:hypothetical protein